MKIIKWTFWGDPKYPEVEWAGPDADKPYEETVVEAIRQHGYRFSGQAHQNAQYGVPVFENGKQYNVSMRHWGRIMAEATGLGGCAYASWAWFPAESGMKVRKKVLRRKTDGVDIRQNGCSKSVAGQKD